MAALASAEGEWQRALMDYHFEDLVGGRNAVEAKRLARRRARRMLPAKRWRHWRRAFTFSDSLTAWSATQ